MKNRLLPLLVVLGSFSAYSQVGIGTRQPHASAQLEVTALDKGVLIPRISLQSATDVASIAGGVPAESLLVFNTNDSATDLKAGYCYWSNSRWNRLAAAGESGSGKMDGISGGTGNPNDPTVAALIPANTTVWIDNSTGTVYIKDPNTGEWKVSTGNSGIDGIAGATGTPGANGAITTLDAIVKDANGDIYAYVGAATTVAGRDAEWKSQSPNWVKINGNNGASGIAGATGTPGADGAITTLDAIVKDANGDIYAYVGAATTVAGRDTEWKAKSPNWVKINGSNGASGIAGATGTPGADGAITTLDAIVKDANGDIYAYVGTATTVAGRDTEWKAKSPNWVKINGNDGENGIAGATGVPGADGAITTLDAIVKDANGDIYAYVGAATTVAGRDAEWKSQSPNWVKITGINGVNGIPGVSGAPGADGKITTLDAIVKDPKGDIYAYVGAATTVEGRDAEWKSQSPNWVKITGLDGANGIAGATGVPGADGAITTLDAIVKDANGDIYAYVGTATTVAGRDAEWKAKSSNWVKITGLNGANGIAGATGTPGADGAITTLDAIVKDANGDIYAYVGTATTVALRDAEWKAKSPSWVKINGNDGKDGMIGGQGAPSPTNPAIDANTVMYIDQTTGIIYVRDANDPSKWVPLNGKDGIDGIAGAQGLGGGAGVPGTGAGQVTPADGITTWIDTTTGIVYVQDPTTKEWKVSTGNSGIDGIPGVSGAPGADGKITTLDAIVKDPKGDIYAYVGAATTVAERNTEWQEKSPNWVKITGLDGANGIAGATGTPGADGAITTLDAIVKDANGDIYAYVGTATTVAGRDAEWKAKSSNWVKITGLNGANGIAGATGTPGADGAITTLDAIVKDANGDIYAYVGTATTVALRDAEWKAKSPSWVKINGNDGKDGMIGGQGAPSPTNPAIDANTVMYIDQTTGIIYVRDANDPSKWVPLNGKDGKDGLAGAPGLGGGAGVPGPTGITPADGITTWVDTNTGITYVYENGVWKPVTGLNGKDGTSVTIKGTVATESLLPPAANNTVGDGYIIDGNLWVWDGTKFNNVGPIQGPKGDDGKSAYDIWVALPGNNGKSVDEFIKASGPVYTAGNGIEISGTNAISILPGSITNGLNLTSGNDALIEVIGGNGALLKNASVNVKAGTDGQILTTDGTTVVWKDAAAITKASATTTTPATVLAVTGTDAVLAPVTVDIVPSTVEGQVLTTILDGAANKVEWKTPVANNVMGIKVTSVDYAVTAADYTIIASKLATDITITLPTAAGNTGRILVVNQIGIVNTSGTEVAVKFNIPVIYSDSVSSNLILTDYYSVGTGGSLKVTLQSDGTNWYVISVM